MTLEQAQNALGGKYKEKKMTIYQAFSILDVIQSDLPASTVDADWKDAEVVINKLHDKFKETLSELKSNREDTFEWKTNYLCVENALEKASHVREWVSYRNHSEV